MRKTILITGASSGIGKATATYFHQQDWNVVATMRTPDQEHDLTALANVLVTRLDVQEADTIHRAVAAGLARFGRIDVLVNNAGYGAIGLLEATPLEKIRRQFDVNVFGAVAVAKAFLPGFRAQRRGFIVNVTSKEAQMEAIQDGAFDDPTRSELGVLIGYRATKAALNRLTNAVADQLARQNITATLVDPGYTQTEKTQLLADRGLVTLEGSHSADYPVAKIIEVLTADKPLAYAGKVLLGYPTGDKG